MTEITEKSTVSIREAVTKRLAKRYRAERRFRFYGILAICFAVLALMVLISRLVQQGWQAFWTYEYVFEVYIDPDSVDPLGDGTEESLRRGSYGTLLQKTLRAQFPKVHSRRDLRQLFRLYSSINSSRLLRQIVDHPELLGKTYRFSMPVSDGAEIYFKRGQKRRFVSMPQAVLDLQIEEGSNRAVLQFSTDVFQDIMRQMGEEMSKRGEGVALKDISNITLYGIELTKDMPSLLVEAAGGVVRLHWLGKNKARGSFLLSPGSLSSMGEKGEYLERRNFHLEKGRWKMIRLPVAEAKRQVSDQQIVWLEALKERGKIKTIFNRFLFLNANSKEPELAGIAAAFWGSIMTIIVTMGLAIPIGVGAAVYLEEFASKNRFTDIIEVNINNLAAVPSIVFGLLGAAVFINFLHFPRSTPLIGGVVLALMTLPTIIITTRASLKAVPPSIREAALGIGASRMQAVMGHVLPLALPGIMTGSIIGLAQAMGETAPLLMVGMVAFIADLPPFAAQFAEAGNFLSGLGHSLMHVPESFTSASTVMPVQVYIWSDAAERAFEQRTAAAILALLLMVVLICPILPSTNPHALSCFQQYNPVLLDCSPNHECVDHRQHYHKYSSEKDSAFETPCQHAHAKQPDQHDGCKYYCPQSQSRPLPYTPQLYHSCD